VRALESATDRTEAYALVDNNIQASSEDILIQLGMHLLLTGMRHRANCRRRAANVAAAVTVTVIY